MCVGEGEEEGGVGLHQHSYQYSWMYDTIQESKGVVNATGKRNSFDEDL